MFNTGINHFLQSFDSQFMANLMKWISFDGNTYFLIFLLFAFFAVYSRRRGIILVNIFMWTVVATVFLKMAIDFPRPLAIDPSLASFGKPYGPDLTALQPHSFFELFSHELLKITRESEVGRMGFPSGHVSFITSIMFGSALFFKKRWYRVFASLIIVLTMLSRVYLAQHFTGDVIGGLVLGSTITLLLWYLNKSFKLSDHIEVNRTILIFLMSPLVLLLFSKYLPTWQTGGLIGINIAYLLALRVSRFRAEPESWSARVFEAVIFASIISFVAAINSHTHFNIPPLFSILIYAAINATGLLVAYALTTLLIRRNS